MFQLDTTNPRVIYRRPTGRLMRPSDRAISGHGLGDLGELDGFLDTLKNFGSGVVKFATAGLYDPSKNRFYVPFSSGQMRNWAQGVTNTTTLGLVKTDKFFNSQTAKTIGTIAGGVAAAGAAAVVGRALYTTYGPSASPPSNVSAVDAGGLLKTGASATTKVVQTTTTAAKAATSTSSMLPSLDTVSKVVDVGAKVIGTMGGGGGAVAPQYAGGGGGTNVIIGAQPVVDPAMAAMYQPAVYTPGAVYPNATGGMFPQDLMMASGPGMVAMPGGGGGFGPPGSEFGGMDVIAPDGTVIQSGGEGMGMGTKVIIAVGAGAVLYYVFMRK